MDLDPHLLADFRVRLGRARDAAPDAWDGSSRLVGREAAPATLARLAAAIAAAPEPPPLREALLAALRGGRADRVQDLPGETLKQLTGLSATKAVRALCLLFGLLTEPAGAASGSSLTSAQIEDFVRRAVNPFDLLLQTDQPSVLDLGAGDLSFAAELADRYVSPLAARSKALTLHCVDRLHPDSKLGGRLHADRTRLEHLRQHPQPGLDFRSWGNQDMFELGRLKGLRPCYTIAACSAPPTPTCAFEPTRLSRAVIERRLRETKGTYRVVREGGEPALEVRHGGKALLFPPWKFEIRGPLALLDLVAQRGLLGVLSAVDAEVFWELLAQLLADDRYRPPDVVFEATTLPEVFGEVHARLTALRDGESVALAEIAPLRAVIPRVLGPEPGPPSRFRSVQIRRGAVFDGVPASSTARLFAHMTEEPPPWMLILVPG